MKLLRNLIVVTLAFLVCLYFSVWVPLQAFDLFRYAVVRVFAAETTDGTIWHLFWLVLVVIVGVSLSFTLWIVTLVVAGAWLNLAIDMDHKRTEVNAMIDDTFARFLAGKKTDG